MIAGRPTRPDGSVRPPPAVVAATLFALLSIVVAVGATAPTDRTVNDTVHRFALQHTRLVDAAEAITNLGSTGVLVWPVGVVALFLLLLRLYRATGWFLAMIAVGSASVALLKVLIARARPVQDYPLLSVPGFAYPSGHSADSAVVYGSILIVLLAFVTAVTARRILIGAVAVLVVTVAATRVLIGVHWIADVIGGLLLGAAVLLTFGPRLHAALRQG